MSPSDKAYAEQVIRRLLGLKNDTFRPTRSYIKQALGYLVRCADKELDPACTEDEMDLLGVYVSTFHKDTK